MPEHRHALLMFDPYLAIAAFHADGLVLDLDLRGSA